MSALDRPKIEDALRVIADAEKALSDVCQGRRRFEMCVPVQATDTDIVIGNALFIARQLQAENARLREALAWIPVGERLPESFEYVLVLIDGESVADVHCHYLATSFDGYDHHFPVGWYAPNGTKPVEDCNITHWMPLPAVPEPRP